MTGGMRDRKIPVNRLPVNVNRVNVKVAKINKKKRDLQQFTDYLMKGIIASVILRKGQIDSINRVSSCIAIG